MIVFVYCYDANDLFLKEIPRVEWIPSKRHIASLMRFGDQGIEEGMYRSPFQHDEEESSPGYYAVFLSRPEVFCELTATARCGFHRYSYEGQGQCKGAHVEILPGENEIVGWMDNVGDLSGRCLP